jgi:hypothetical protein
VLIWLALVMTIIRMGSSQKRTPLLVALNIVSMGTIATLIALVWNWGGVCVDVLNVASPAAIWGEWIACGPLLVFITVTVDNKPRLTKMDWFMMVTFFLCLITGLFIIPPQPFGLAQFWLFVSCLTYAPLLYLPWYTNDDMGSGSGQGQEVHSLIAEDEAQQRQDSDNHAKSISKIEHGRERYYLSVWLTIILPIFTVNYLAGLWGAIDYAKTIAIYQILSVLTKGLFTAICMDTHVHLLIRAEMALVEERRLGEVRANDARRNFMKYIFHEVS